ncbi:MAG: hypothetical protein ACREYF_11025, partial [Gammaproteobacteria bacterium]
VNLKAEIEIMTLHEKMDALRAEQLVTVIAQQQMQIELLRTLVDAPDRGPRNAPRSSVAAGEPPVP